MNYNRGGVHRIQQICCASYLFEHDERHDSQRGEESGDEDHDDAHRDAPIQAGQRRYPPATDESAIKGKRWR